MVLADRALLGDASLCRVLRCFPFSKGDVTDLEVGSRQLPCLGNNQGCAGLCRSVTHREREELGDLCKQSSTLPALSPDYM